MGRKRKTNKHLPTNVYINHGAAFYCKDNKLIKLCRASEGLAEIYRQLSKHLEKPTNLTTMAQIIDRYMIDIAPFHAASTYKKDSHYVKKIKEIFGHMSPSDITPKMIYRVMDEYVQVNNSIAGANKIKGILSRIYTSAIRWGFADNNPCRNVKSFKLEPRKYLPSWDDIRALYRISPPLVRYMIDFAYITGLRRGDILKIKRNDTAGNVLSLTEGKTGKIIPRKISPKLRRIINRIIRYQAKRDITSIYLFATRDGQRYTDSGFSSLWKRAMTKALDKGVLQKSFMLKDMRSRAASDIPLDHAKALLGHSNEQTTIRHYRRDQKPINPVR